MHSLLACLLQLGLPLLRCSHFLGVQMCLPMMHPHHTVRAALFHSLVLLMPMCVKTLKLLPGCGRRTIRIWAPALGTPVTSHAANRRCCCLHHCLPHLGFRERVI